mgnify:CR=1 FL=1
MSKKEEFKSHKAYIYAENVVNGNLIENEYIKKIAKQFLENLEKEEDESYEYYFDYKFLDLITSMTHLINMASGPRVGEPVHEALAGFQWFFLVNTLCWKHKDDKEKRKYEKSVLLIARKSGKTFLVAILFILLLLLEPQYSEFYSVAPDRELSSIIKKEMEQHIEMSPLISKHFRILSSEIRCLLTKSKFVPLATSNNRMDGRKANVFVADEVGALRNSGPISAMESSQMNMKNRTGILISTAYESLQNPMTEEVHYAEKVIDGLIEDDKLFAMLYRPDDNKKWLDDDELLKANPLAAEIPENMEFLKKQRDQSIEIPSKQKTFKTKHMNIFVDGDDAEVYISTEDLIKNRLEEPFNWRGKNVYLGVDLAQSVDNTSVAMVHYDEENDLFYMKSWAFVPKDSVDLKSKLEKVDYNIMIENGYAFANGDRVVNYRDIENFIMDLEDEYGVNVLGIGYDRWNAISSMNRISEEKNYDVVEIKQHSSELHAPTKLLKEYVLQKKAKYEKNTLFEINVANAKEVKDTNLNTYISKKVSTGKVDMLVATINAIKLWNLESLEGRSIYETQGIRIL